MTLCGLELHVFMTANFWRNTMERDRIHCSRHDDGQCLEPNSQGTISNNLYRQSKALEFGGS
eukprot:5968339-Pleurochrysis_carterae.AAC.1